MQLPVNPSDGRGNDENEFNVQMAVWIFHAVSKKKSEWTLNHPLLWESCWKNVSSLQNEFSVKITTFQIIPEFFYWNEHPITP